MEFELFDFTEDWKKTEEALSGSQELEDLTGEITVDDVTSIVTFGADAAKAVGKASDQVLKSVNNNRLGDASGMLSELAEVMAKVDGKELEAKPSGFLGKLFGRQEAGSMDELLERYQALGLEVDRVYVKLRAYEKDILASARQLSDLAEANIDYYRRLEKYILAGEQGMREIDAYIRQFQEEYNRTKAPDLSFQLSSLQQARGLLEHRLHDLRLAQTVAMQAIPMVQMVQYQNLELARKINSAFIVTLPAFKQALSHAILQKRQSLQREAVHALEERTRQMMEEAGRTAAQARQEGGTLPGKAGRPEGSLSQWKEQLSGEIRETRQLLEKTGQEQTMKRKELEAARQTAGGIG